MSAENLITIPARKGKAARVKKGQRVKLINTHGSQVVDTWAFNSDDLTEFMSMEYTRVALGSILPKAGVTLVTNRRRPILAFLGFFIDRCEVLDKDGNIIGVYPKCDPSGSGGANFQIVGFFVQFMKLGGAAGALDPFGTRVAVLVE